ncbi:HET-domain-containing protein [Cubamyces sp. BRFM 1775]|nr:HET-domain-containing protein [Cubamyces sp. BRFM 1775]
MLPDSDPSVEGRSSPPPRYGIRSLPEQPPTRPESICAAACEGIFAAHRRPGVLYEWICEDPDALYPSVPVYEDLISWKGWLQCASSGCVWCRFLERNFLSRLGKWDRDELFLRVRPSNTWRDVIAITLGDQEIRFHLHTAADDPAATWIKDRARKPHIEPPEQMLAIARACVENCVRNHGKCQDITQYPVGTAPLPTRLIDCSDLNRLRLIETNDIEREPYIALSYVWGPELNKPYLTTTETLHLHMERIGYASLPPTIRDAVDVTRGLGVRLLWVDGLCIIQDSAQDMHRELARMRGVYRNAYLTIDAGSAASVAEGFLKDRRPLDPRNWLPFICCHPEPPTDDSAQAAIGKVYWDPLVGDSAHAWQGVGTVSDARGRDGGLMSRTVTRGWCLQERLLSTRSLVFTRETVQLRCHTKTQNVDGVPHDDLLESPRLPDAILHPGRQVAHGSDVPEEIHVKWMEIMEDYSCRLLTSRSDKLVAIAGLAEMFAPALGPEYVAGLWRDTLILNLVWWRRKPSLMRYTGLEYRAPSWSWASGDGGIHYEISLASHEEEERKILLADVAKCTVVLQDERLPFGQVVGGSLQLSVHLLQVQWTYSEDEDIVVHLQPIPSAFDNSPYRQPRGFHRHTGYSYVDYDHEKGVLEDVWVAPLVYKDFAGRDTPHRPDTQHGWYEWFGLLITHAGLEESPNGDPNAHKRGEVYRRVGVGLFRGYDQDTGLSVLDMIQLGPKVAVELV